MDCHSRYQCYNHPWRSDTVLGLECVKHYKWSYTVQDLEFNTHWDSSNEGCCHHGQKDGRELENKLHISMLTVALDEVDLKADTEH